jgi:2,3,4,5-tetrahydropyridine-2,6-dicarboxylate N-succinyltransferase
MQLLQDVIQTAFNQRELLTPDTFTAEQRAAITTALQLLDSGQARVADYQNGQWHVNHWLKQAVLLSFRMQHNVQHHDGVTAFFDKVPLKFADYTTEKFQQLGSRVVPPAYVRHGAYIGKNCVLMPSYVNIGAYVDDGCMIDTWATVGSCAQIGKNVHISGGVGIAGVLEPLQANPVIIEDNCFIGARSEIVEGVLVERNAVISMGVYLGQSTKIYDRTSGEIFYGRVPAGAVVVPGNLPASDGSHSLYCAVIVKYVDEKTRNKVSLNELLRGI